MLVQLLLKRIGRGSRWRQVHLSLSCPEAKKNSAFHPPIFSSEHLWGNAVFIRTIGVRAVFEEKPDNPYVTIERCEV
jgi:hypothetical protein